jgi:hypothetical protein
MVFSQTHGALTKLLQHFRLGFGDDLWQQRRRKEELK